MIYLSPLSLRYLKPPQHWNSYPAPPFQAENLFSIHISSGSLSYLFIKYSISFSLLSIHQRWFQWRYNLNHSDHFGFHGDRSWPISKIQVLWKQIAKVDLKKTINPWSIAILFACLKKTNRSSEQETWVSLFPYRNEYGDPAEYLILSGGTQQNRSCYSYHDYLSILGYFLAVYSTGPQ